MSLMILRLTLIVAVGATVLASASAMVEPVRLSTAASVHPVLIRNDHNPLVEVRIEAERDDLRLHRMTVSLEGTDDFSDLEMIEVLAPAVGSGFPTGNRFGRPAAAAREVIFEGDHALARGSHSFWVSCRLRSTAVLTHGVAATCLGVVTSAGEVKAELPPVGLRHRIGVALRRAFDDGVHTHRIPVLATSVRGTLLAVCDLRRREARDLQGDIDIGLIRSVNGGQSWEAPRVVMDMGEHGGLPQDENGCSDPGLVVDRETGDIFCFALWMHGRPGQHQWSGRGSEPGFDIGKTAQFMMVRSGDDGLTWSAPVNLTRHLKQEQWWLLAPSPQQGIQLTDGTLVMPVQGRDEDGVPFATIMLSQDHGSTWTVSAPARGQANECQAAALSDGAIMLNMRNDAERHRAVAVTRDRGKTWAPHPAAEKALLEPNCNASLLAVRYRDGEAMRQALVFANPRSTTERRHQTIQVSFDDGMTWPGSWRLPLDEGAGFGYPSLTQVDDEHLGIVYEGSQAQLVFEKLSLTELGLPAGVRRWAQPGELRAKKLIDAGIYTLDSSPIPMHSRSLSENPEFTSHHPFDGLAVRAALAWSQVSEEAQKPGSMEVEGRDECCLDAFAWSKRTVPESLAMAAVEDFRRVAWGTLTDNFLWWNCRGASEALKGDVADEADWQAMRSTVKLAARICHEAGLKGFIFDTEQYGQYAGSGKPYPFGEASPDLLRRRGRDWIEAVQSEFPDVRIMLTFGWSPDLGAAGFLAGVQPFLDGMLDGIVTPGRIIHGYENTFYYGQRAGSRFTETGFAGGRGRYEEARRLMRSWRSFSGNTEKFDMHVDVGLAAWLESDPWNLWSGYPSGTRDTVWSNVPLALATADEYVWCWSEHTNYLHSATQPEAGRSGLNPFLASLTNQTFNTGREAADWLEEDFSNNPLARGWYFDFDILNAGCRMRPDDKLPVLSPEVMWARWLEGDRVLRVGEGHVVARKEGARVMAGPQRRRFVHPVRPLTGDERFAGSIDFRIDDFGEATAKTVVFGFFSSGQPVRRGALAVGVGATGAVHWVLPGGWVGEVTVARALQRGVVYRVEFNFGGVGGQLHGKVIALDGGVVMGSVQSAAHSPFGTGGLDEIGVALTESDDGEMSEGMVTASVKAVRMRME